MKIAMRVSKDELLQIAKERQVLLKTGPFWVDISVASKEWIDKSLPDVGEYEIREEDGVLIAQYVG